MNIAKDIDEIVERHHNMVIAAYRFFGKEEPEIRITYKEQDDCNYFIQFSTGHSTHPIPVYEITTELRDYTLTVKVHNFVVEVMEVFSVTAERK